MTKPTATQRLARLLALVPWVAAHPDGVPVDQVCERFGVTRDELVDDLDVVMMVGVHPFTPDTMIEAWIDGDRVVIHYADAFSRPLRLTADEAVTLIAAARGLATVPGAEPDGPLRRSIAKLAVVAGAGDAAGVDVDLGGASAEVFGVLDAAQRDRRQVEIEYPDADGARGVTRRIEPARLFSSGGRWYVSGWCHRAEDTRVFRVDRVLAARATDEAFEAPSDDAPDEVEFDEALPQVSLEVDRSAAWLLDPVPALAREEAGDTVRFRLAIGSSSWLARVIVQLGPAVRILDADPSLDVTALAARQARQVRDRYR